MKPAKKDPHQTTNAVMHHIKRGDTTIRQCSVALSIPRTCVWRAVKALQALDLIHIKDYDYASTGRNASAIFTWGQGDDAIEDTDRGFRQNATSDEPIPIPSPQLGAWGCVWNTTTSANGAHQEKAA